MRKIEPAEFFGETAIQIPYPLCARLPRETGLHRRSIGLSLTAWLVATLHTALNMRFGALSNLHKDATNMISALHTR